MDAATIAYTTTSPIQIRGHPRRRLMVVFRTVGCAWGRCTICHFRKHAHPAATDDSLRRQAEAVSEMLQHGDFAQLDLLTLGNFFNDREISPAMRQELLERAAQAHSVKRVLVESRREYVDERKLLEARRLLRNDQRLVYALGYESSNPTVRNALLGKGVGEEDLDQGLALCRAADVDFVAYILIKPPPLTEREGIADAVDSAVHVLQKAKRYGVNASIAFEPVFVTDRAAFRTRANGEPYRPPALWSVAEVVIQTAERIGPSHARGRLFVGLSDENLSRGRMTANCGVCDDRIRAAIQAFNGHQDIRALKRLHHSCKEAWRETAMEKSRGALSPTLAAAALTLVTMAWGLSFFLVKKTLADMDVFFFLFLRFGLAFLTMLLLFPARILRAPPKSIVASCLLGAPLSISYIAQTEGLRHTGAANSALITGLYMVLIPLFSALGRRSNAESYPWIGIGLAFLGMVLLTQGDFVGINRGDGMSLVCACALAVHTLLTDHYSRQHQLVPLVGIQLLFVALVCGGISVFRGAAATPIPPLGLATIAVTALFATVAAFLIQTAAQRVLSPSRTGVIMALEAVFGAAAAWALGGETVTALSAIGACLIVSGMIASERGVRLGTLRDLWSRMLRALSRNGPRSERQQDPQMVVDLCHRLQRCTAETRGEALR